MADASSGAPARGFRWSVALAVGLLIPPVGTCLNVASAISRLGTGRIFKVGVAFLMANAITLVLTTVLPSLSLWLPVLLMK